MDVVEYGGVWDEAVWLWMRVWDVVCGGGVGVGVGVVVSVSVGVDVHFSNKYPAI